MNRVGDMFINWLQNIQVGISNRSRVRTSVGFWGTVEALYPNCRSIASAAFRLATFLLGPVPVATSLFTFTCMCADANTDTQVHTHEIRTPRMTIFSDLQLNFIYVQKHPVVMNHWMTKEKLLKWLFSWLSSSCHSSIHFQAENTLLRFWAESAVQSTSHKKAPSEVFVFQWSQNIKSVYAECKQIFPREYQTSLCYANRQLHSTNNILGAKACEQPGLSALTQSGLTCSLSARLNASSRLQHTMRREASINCRIAKINKIALS